MRTSGDKVIKQDEKTIFIASNLFVFFLSVYLLTSSDIMLYDTDASKARYEVTKSIVESFDLSIPQGLGFKGIDGREYSWYGLGKSFLLFLSKNIYWHGDWSWGPRYLLALTPFFIIPIAEIFSSDTWFKKKLRRVTLYSILILSLIIQIAAVSVDYSKHLTKLRFEENLDFSIVRSQDLQPIVEPPPEIYFDWERSPVLFQFIYIYEIFSNMKNFEYSKPIEGATVQEKMRAAPFYNVFDFWWFYKYFIYGSYSAIFVALIFLLIDIYAANKLWKLS